MQLPASCTSPDNYVTEAVGYKITGNCRVTVAINNSSYTSGLPKYDSSCNYGVCNSTAIPSLRPPQNSEATGNGYDVHVVTYIFGYYLDTCPYLLFCNILLDQICSSAVRPLHLGYYIRVRLENAYMRNLKNSWACPPHPPDIGWQGVSSLLPPGSGSAGGL